MRIPFLAAQAARSTAAARAATAKGAPEAKASRVGPLLAFPYVGKAVWTPRDYAALAREGFMRNAIVYRAVRMIAEATASVPWLLYDGAVEVDDHPLLKLLAQPNRRQAGADFREAVAGYLLGAGNAYIEVAAVDGIPRELYALRPDRMKVVPGPDGWPEAYEYTAAGRTVRFTDPGEGELAPILQLALFHPLDDHYGFAPIEAAAYALDTHNAAAAWNKALLDNSARPSGALVYSAKDGGNLSSEQYERLKGELETGFTGAARAGRPLLLEGGLDWKTMSLSPKDMDFLEAKNAAAREVALTFGVPPMLLGIPGDNTYANYKEANAAFWRGTVLPLAAKIAGALSEWLTPAYGEGLRLWFDPDQVDALSGDREALWARVAAADFLTVNEKRAAVGYGAIDGGDALGGGVAALSAKYSPDQPRVPAGSADGGQWTAEGGGEGAGSGSSAEGTGEQVAQADRGGLPVDLAEEESRGRHAIADHVGKSPDALLERAGQKYRSLLVDVVVYRAGSFPSLAAATKLVNSTISQNLDIVNRVAAGIETKAFVTATFSSQTGIEAYRPTPDSQPYLRDTYGVGVAIVHDDNSPNGYTVVTAYPRND